MAVDIPLTSFLELSRSLFDSWHLVISVIERETVRGEWGRERLVRKREREGESERETYAHSLADSARATRAQTIVAL